MCVVLYFFCAQVYLAFISNKSFVTLLLVFKIPELRLATVFFSTRLQLIHNKKYFLYMHKKYIVTYTKVGTILVE